MPWEGQLIRHTDAISPLLLAVGTLSLLAGSLVYLLDRPADSTVLFHTLSDHLDWSAGRPGWFGMWGNHLPSFVHVLAFSLIHMGIAEKKRPIQAGICLFWFAVNLVFELGQKYPDTATALIRPFDGLPFLDKALPFFSKGTYDPLDILAFAAGSLAAFALVLLMDKRSEKQ